MTQTLNAATDYASTERARQIALIGPFVSAFRALAPGWEEQEDKGKDIGYYAPTLKKGNAEIDFSAAAYHKGRICISGSVSRPLQDFMQRGYDADAPQFTIAPTRDLAQIARQVVSKIVTPLGEIIAQAEQNKRKHDEMQSARRNTIQTLCKLGGRVFEEPTSTKWYTQDGQYVPDTARIRPDTFCFYGKATCEYNGTLTLELNTVPADLAAQIIGLLRDYAKV